MTQTYLIEFRTRGNRDWQPAEELTDLARATQLRDDAIKYTLKGTKDWRVRALS